MEDKQFIQAKKIYESIEAPEELREKVLVRVEHAAREEIAERNAKKPGQGRNRRGFDLKRGYGGGLIAACFMVFIMVWAISADQIPESLSELDAKNGTEAGHSTYDVQTAQEEASQIAADDGTASNDNAHDSKSGSRVEKIDESSDFSSDQHVEEGEPYANAKAQAVYGLQTKKDHDKPLKPQSRQMEDNGAAPQVVSHEDQGGRTGRNGIECLPMNVRVRRPLVEKNHSNIGEKTDGNVYEEVHNSLVDRDANIR